MKRKNYKITIKLKYETTMLHSGTSAEKAISDVVKVWTDILKQDRTLKNLFESILLLYSIINRMIIATINISIIQHPHSRYNIFLHLEENNYL